MKPRRRGAVDVGQRTVGDSMRYAASGSRLLTRVWIFGPYFQGSTRLDYQYFLSFPFLPLRQLRHSSRCYPISSFEGNPTATVLLHHHRYRYRFPAYLVRAERSLSRHPSPTPPQDCPHQPCNRSRHHERQQEIRALQAMGGREDGRRGPHWHFRRVPRPGDGDGAAS